MDTRRLILFALLFVVAMMLWDAWQADYPNVVTTAPNQSTNLSSTTSSTAIPTSTLLTTTSTPVITQHQLVQVHTDVVNATIDTQGGNIIRLTLPSYPVDINHPNEPFVLLNNDPNTLYVAQSGLLGQIGPDASQGQAIYRTSQTEYSLAPGQHDLAVSLTWQSPQGLIVTKTFHFQANSYLIQIDYQIINHTHSVWSGQFYAQLQRKKDLQVQ